MKRILLAAALITVCGAAPAQAGDGTVLGTLGGAALGGFIGNQFGHGAGRAAATGLGIFTGAIIGNSFGQSLDRDNYGYYPRTYNGQAPYYTRYARSYYYPRYYEPTYVAPPPAQVVFVQPRPRYVRTTGRPYCREYTQQVRIDGQLHESYGTACLGPDGAWRVER